MGRYGQKTGAGWYAYEPGSRTRRPDPLIDELAAEAAARRGIVRRPIAPDEIIARIMTALANEGARVLEDGYAIRASDIDVIYCYGFGFPGIAAGRCSMPTPSDSQRLERVKRCAPSSATIGGPPHCWNDWRQQDEGLAVRLRKPPCRRDRDLMIEIPDAAWLRDRIGQEIAVSDWLDVPQQRIDRFAEATEDRQWIHVDPVRASAESPFKTTVALGFLTLSLVSALTRRAMTFSGIRMAVNYGLNRVRFMAPVPAGARIRGRFSPVAVSDGRPEERQECGRHVVRHDRT
jgi:acyl dehydratase